jgi:hypothetical protein
MKFYRNKTCRGPILLLTGNCAPSADQWHQDLQFLATQLPAHPPNFFPTALLGGMIDCCQLFISGRGAAWLARLLGVQEVPSSNLGGPTKFLKELEAISTRLIVVD